MNTPLTQAQRATLIAQRMDACLDKYMQVFGAPPANIENYFVNVRNMPWTWLDIETLQGTLKCLQLTDAKLLRTGPASLHHGGICDQMWGTVTRQPKDPAKQAKRMRERLERFQNRNALLQSIFTVGTMPEEETQIVAGEVFNRQFHLNCVPVELEYLAIQKGYPPFELTAQMHQELYREAWALHCRMRASPLYDVVSGSAVGKPQKKVCNKLWTSWEKWNPDYWEVARIRRQWNALLQRVIEAQLRKLSVHKSLSKE